MKKTFFILTFLSFPFIANAQSTTTSLADILTGFGGLVKLAIPLVFGLAVLFFFYGMVKYIFAAGNVNSKNDGKSIMIWGIIALFVMTSIVGIIKFINDNLAIQPQTITTGN